MVLSEAYREALLEDEFLQQDFATAISLGTSLYLSFHSAAVAIGDDQTTNEIAYTGYARLAVPRDGANWDRDLNSISNKLVLTFPQNTGTTTATVRYICTGVAASGVGAVMRIMPWANPSGLVITPGMTPQLLSSELMFRFE